MGQRLAKKQQQQQRDCGADHVVVVVESIERSAAGNPQEALGMNANEQQSDAQSTPVVGEVAAVSAPRKMSERLSWCFSSVGAASSAAARGKSETAKSKKPSVWLKFSRKGKSSKQASEKAPEVEAEDIYASARRVVEDSVANAEEQRVSATSTVANGAANVVDPKDIIMNTLLTLFNTDEVCDDALAAALPRPDPLLLLGTSTNSSSLGSGDSMATLSPATSSNLLHASTCRLGGGSAWRLSPQQRLHMFQELLRDPSALGPGAMLRLQDALPRIHSQVDFIHCLVPDLQQIHNCSFYWGKMDRYEAEKLLDGKPEGTFLLRDSAQEDFLFSVSFRKYGRNLHARIEQLNHEFSFDSQDPGVFTAPTVTGLLEHYKDPSCVMFFEPMLTRPLNRVNTFKLQELCRATIVSHTSYDGVDQLMLPKSLKSYLKVYHYRHRLCVKQFDEGLYVNS